jgi:hypothetical protein
MPYPNEHAARVIEPGECDSFKRMNQGSGVSLILCIKDDKSSAQAYRFKKDKFTPEQAKAWLKKHNIEYKSFEEASEDKNMNAKLSVKASNGQPEIDGRIWSAGMHHVFVNDEPARVYVPEETIMNTFNSVRELINREGRMPIGIDHLSNDVLADNEILAKMNLLDVGGVSKVGTDGQSIYILDSEITNQQIRELNSQGALPSYSIVGGMDAKPCPTGQADYVVNSIDVERVDIVEEGGCQVCKVGAQPDNLILTSKKSMEDFDMVNANEAPVEAVEEVEEIEEVPVEEAVEEVEEEVEAVEDGVQIEEEEEGEEEVVVEEEPSEMDSLKEEIKSLKDEIKNLGGKKPKVAAKDAEKAVVELIKAGKALPKMKAGLIATYEADPEAFATLAASMPKMVQMETQAKLAKKDKDEEEKKKKQAEADAQKAQLEQIFGVKL